MESGFIVKELVFISCLRSQINSTLSFQSLLPFWWPGSIWIWEVTLNRKQDVAQQILHEAHQAWQSSEGDERTTKNLSYFPSNTLIPNTFDSSMQIVREHYLRDDIYCGVLQCKLCENTSALLSAPPSTILVLDTNVVLHQVIVFSSSWIKIIFFFFFFILRFVVIVVV